ncbi:50S ribosomal protein L23 [archaeon]|nr:50S ribosomal protein L23 [archaeon]
MDVWKVLKYPYMTEKSIALIERENKIVFVVDVKANKKKIKEAFEKAFEVKVDKISTQITLDGKKKAFIKIKPEFKAADVAVKLGIM